jgi:hypothetical protein
MQGWRRRGAAFSQVARPDRGKDGPLCHSPHRAHRTKRKRATTPQKRAQLWSGQLFLYNGASAERGPPIRRSEIRWREIWPTLTRRSRTAALADDVVSILKEHEIESVVIGAMALAVHGYPGGSSLEAAFSR